MFGSSAPLGGSTFGPTVGACNLGKWRNGLRAERLSDLSVPAPQVMTVDRIHLLDRAPSALHARGAANDVHQPAAGLGAHGVSSGHGGWRVPRGTVAYKVYERGYY